MMMRYTNLLRYADISLLSSEMETEIRFTILMLSLMSPGDKKR